MKTRTAVIALAAALFTVAAFADHNRTDEQGRKQGHWTEFPEQEDLLAMEGNYVDGREDGNWVWQWASGKVSEGPMKNGKQHGEWVTQFADGDVRETSYKDGVCQEEIRWYASGGAVKTIYNREAMPDTDDEKYSGEDGFDKWFADQKAWEKRNVRVIAVGSEPVIADFDDVDEWRKVHEEWAERKEAWEKQQNAASASGNAGN